jgi:hypothetical protein
MKDSTALSVIIARRVLFRTRGQVDRKSRRN